MKCSYEKYQIPIERLKLPSQHKPLKNLTICGLTERSEFQAVLRLFFKIFPDELDSEKAAELQDMQISQYEGSFVAKIHDKIIGFLISGIINNTGYISYLGVEEAYRGKGVGTALLREFKKYLKEKKIEYIKCTIRKDNEKTLNYIHSLGFNCCEPI
ncbi:MAG: GNAT family N-acetyltransferase [Candidatus Helarchaeota archaeon]